jgi:hypothetical protein
MVLLEAGKEAHARFEQTKLTSVNMAIQDMKWIKDNNLKMNNVLKAGIVHIKEGSQIQYLNEQILRLNSDLGRAKAHRDIIFYIFKNHPEIYLEAKKAVGDGI